MIRLLRGRALLELHESELAADYQQGGIWIPSEKPREKKIHRGRVLALGPPARQKARGKIGPEIPWGCAVGDEVLFVYGEWLESMRRFENQVVVSQAELQGVIECGAEDTP